MTANSSIFVEVRNTAYALFRTWGTPGVGLVGCLTELVIFGSFGPRFRHMGNTHTRIPAFSSVHHKSRYLTAEALRHPVADLIDGIRREVVP